jgi:hypothetical protein
MVRSWPLNPELGTSPDRIVEEIRLGLGVGPAFVA